MKLRIAMCATFSIVLALAHPAQSQSSSTSSPAPNASSEPPVFVVLIPFGPPGNKDYQLDAATNDFAARLTAKKNMIVAQAKPMDVADVGGSAADLCKQYKSSSIFVGTARHEQNHNIMWGTFPTHAEVRVTQLGCDGKTKWKGVGIADKVQYWSNPAAAVTNVIQLALDQIISEMPT